jgi:hypothetical protein
MIPMKRILCIALTAVLMVAALAGCGTEEATATPDPVEAVGNEPDTGAVVDASYTGALDVGSQLALGTLQLEDMEDSVTPGQAAALLPLWQAIRGGALQGEAELNAVLKQIEGQMTTTQIAAIADLQLTWDDLQAWAKGQGLNLNTPPEDMAERMGKMGQELSPEVQATMEARRATGGGPPTEMSEKDREAMRATAEASGMSFADRGTGDGRGQLAMLAEPLIELLSQRAAEG